MGKKIFGREPAVFFALVAGILLAVIRFVPFTPEVSGALNAAVLAGAGLATAATVSAERALPALVGLVQAVFAVFLAYGSPVPESTQTGILALIAAGASFFVRGNVLARLDADGQSWEARLTDSTHAAYDNGYRGHAGRRRDLRGGPAMTSQEWAGAADRGDPRVQGKALADAIAHAGREVGTAPEPVWDDLAPHIQRQMIRTMELLREGGWVRPVGVDGN